MIKSNKFMDVNTYDLEQGTDLWLMSRAGVITASRAHEIIKPGRKKGTYSAARESYMLELIAQVCTGKLAGSASFKQAEWGHENEPLAREAYSAIDFDIVDECGLFYKDESLRAGISPDGLILDESRGLEIKCPFTTQVHINTLLNGEIKPEYLTQCQFSMWASDYDRWDFCSFDYRMRGIKANRLHVIPQIRDNEIMDKFELEIPKFITEMDEKLNQLGFEFGQQWEL